MPRSQAIGSKNSNINHKNQILLGLEPTGHYLALGIMTMLHFLFWLWGNFQRKSLKHKDLGLDIIGNCRYEFMYLKAFRHFHLISLPVPAYLIR